LKQFGLSLLHSVSRNKKTDKSPKLPSLFLIFFILLLSSCQTVRIKNLKNEKDDFVSEALQPQQTITFLDDTSIFDLSQSADFYNLNKSQTDSDIENVSICSFNIKSPDQKIDAECSLVKINLKNPELKIEIADSLEACNADQADYVAINSVPFAYSGKKAEPVGVVKIEKDQRAQLVEKYAAFLFTKQADASYSVKIIENQKAEDCAEFDNAIGGFYQILSEGELRSFKHFRNSRVALGVTADSQYVYLFTALSNSLTDESALTYEECGKILKAFGCNNALQFDGGRSSLLNVNEIEKSSLIGKSRKKDIPYFLVFICK